MNNDYSFKIALVGGSAVGKSSLISKFTKNDFSYGYKPTININSSNKDLVVNGKKINLLIQELGGDSKFKSFKKKIFKNSPEGLILVYDLERPNLLNNLEYWIRVNKKNNKDYNKCQTILLGNKLDKHVEDEETNKLINNFLKEHKEEIKTYYQTSAMTGENVKKAFRNLINLILENE